MRLEEIVPEFDLLRPSSLRAALQIDLFQHIALADGKLPLSELTAHYHTYDAYVLRLLILSLDEYGYVNVENDLVSLTSKGSLIVENIDFFDQLANSSTASGLFSYAALSLHDRLIGKPDYFKTNYGFSYWQVVNSDERLCESLGQTRNGTELIDTQFERSQLSGIKEVATAQTVLELGCGYGDTAYYLLKNTSIKHLILSDLSNRIELVRRQSRWETFSRSVRFMPLDFFHDQLPMADIVLLDSILADWDHADCVAILRHIRDSMGDSKSTLVVSEITAFSTSSSVDAIGKLALACAVPGRVREPEEVRELVLEAGFSSCELSVCAPVRFTLLGCP